MKEIILIVGGGHCKAVIDVIEQEGKFQIAGIVDNSVLIETVVLGYPVIGSDSDLNTLVKIHTHAIVTVGQIKLPDTRIKLFNLANNGFGAIKCFKDKEVNKLVYFNLVLFDKMSVHLVQNSSENKWKKKGIVKYDGTDFKTNLRAALILPDGKPGTPTFLVFENYELILKWNRSLRFALAVCTLKNEFKNAL